MPSQTTSWITKHDGLSVLHVTSTDPRRNGCHDLAIFESDLIPILSQYTWRIRHGQIENQYGKSLLGIITSIRKLGTTQIEPNCDFTKDNLTPRPAPKMNGTLLLDKFKQENPDWREIIWNKRCGCELFKPMKYRSRSEWTTLTISLADGGSLDIKVNKWMVGKIPTKMVFRPKRPHNQLYLLPNRVQIKRRKHENDRRHGKALTAYLLEECGSETVRNSRLMDRFDYRLDDNGEFIQSCMPKNEWIDTILGTVLKVIYPKGYCNTMWDTPTAYQYPRCGIFKGGEERIGYFLISDLIADSARDAQWIMDEYEPFTNNYKDKKVRLAKLVCELSGVQVSNLNTPSRMSKYYEKAINGTDNRSLRRRAKFENTITTEQKTSNHMYVHGKFISHHRLHLEKTIHIPELNITALDMRIESIRVGGSSEIK